MMPQPKGVVAYSGLRTLRAYKNSRGGGHFQNVGGIGIYCIYCSAQKKNQNRCHQTRFLGSKCFCIRGPEPRWWSSQRSPRPSSWIQKTTSWPGRMGRKSRGTEGRGGEGGRERGREREWGGGVVVLGWIDARASVTPGNLSSDSDSCDLWSQSWSFHTPLVPLCIKISSFVFRISCS